jgi:hypothetical protein
LLAIIFIAVEMLMWKHDNSYSVRNRIELVKGGACYFELLRKLIATAKHSIYIRVYIWSTDATGTAVAIRKAAQNNPTKASGRPFETATFKGQFPGKPIKVYMPHPIKTMTANTIITDCRQ